VHHVGILYGQFMMHGQRNIKSIISGQTVIYIYSIFLYQLFSCMFQLTFGCILKNVTAVIFKYIKTYSVWYFKAVI